MSRLIQAQQFVKTSPIKSLVIGVGAVLVIFTLLQLIPLNQTNPPAVNAMIWSSPEAEQLAVKACYDCHSNETNWRWYTKVAPFSFLVSADVNGGRDHLNFSEWNSRARIGELVEVINDGSMPPLQYTLIHPSAKLSDAEKQILVDGLRQSVSQN